MEKEMQHMSIYQVLQGHRHKDRAMHRELIDIEFVNAAGQHLRSGADKARGGAATMALQQLGVSGKLVAGRLNAIMGPSGCGKTTLIKVLSGRMLPAKHVDVVDATRGGLEAGSEAMPRSGLSSLRFRENLDYAACLRMRPGTPGSWRSAVVYAIMKDLELYTRENQVVGSEQRPAISGGERKRVNIGMGVVALPPILFLDEPTSGLDTRMSEEVVRLTWGLARVANMNVICVIHQPSTRAFDMFDFLMLLSHDQRVAYLGPPEACRDYFYFTLKFQKDFQGSDGSNVADAILRITSDTGSNKLSESGIRGEDITLAWLAGGRERLYQTANRSTQEKLE
ncbi:hypothetical protein GPECTOR_73g645 [Gonium pectorale]|uniref:ABC transporter domain-containing protein n=1 Tax=Gonium pectorale TaxID=33097 RepID=A0A150G2S8_GONPE|nr:hypothetical protein GPECTOR_73g645 [Gonium pectorale]|eukprot:KXZ44124.1 hypothetical protein GPECTOR_73g645 [Gonium pectorale]